MRVVITNTVMLNGGDTAILKAIITGIMSKYGQHTKIKIYDSQADVAKKYYPELFIAERLHTEIAALEKRPVNSFLGRVKRKFQRNLSSLMFSLLQRGHVSLARRLMLPKVRAIFDDYKAADIIISTGGTYLVENYSIKTRSEELNFALASGRPLVLFTQSMGPFTQEKNRELLSQVFPKCALILLRDEASLENCRSVNSEENMQVSSDVVFATAVEKELQEASAAKQIELKHVAVSVRHWPYFKQDSTEQGMERYLDAVRRGTEYIIDTHGAHVTFISTCQGIPEYWVDDAKVAQSVYEMLSPKHQAKVTIDANFHDPFELQDKLAAFDLVVATRLHAAILSLARGTPVVPISYEFKTTELFQRFGVGEYVSDIDTVTGEELVRKIQKFVEHYSSFNEQLFNSVLAEHERAKQSFDALNQVLEMKVVNTSIEAPSTAPIEV